MSLDNHFCSSPWFHVRINNQGQYEYCRWANAEPQHSESVIKFFQQDMASIRSQMLAGSPVDECKPCYEMEAHNKVSGRQKQLLKVGVQTDNFEKTMSSSPWLHEFDTTNNNNGLTTLYPQDWQIDLGNYCNGACVFCKPEFSSKLAAELKGIGVISELPPNSWCNDTSKVDEFVDTLLAAPKIRYLHFIGGETLIIPAFAQILKALVDKGYSQHITVGFTTNLISWPDYVIDLLGNFKVVNVGVSIETLTTVNDYVRWPATINQVKITLDRWVELAKTHHWPLQIRTTPTLLTIHDLLSVYNYAWQNNVIVESCNFIQNPKFLSPLVLPSNIRQQVAVKFKDWLADKSASSSKITNIRNPDFAKDLLVQDLTSYVEYLNNAPDESHLLPEAVTYLKKLDANRGNSVIDYLPEYEELLRAAGY